MLGPKRNTNRGLYGPENALLCMRISAWVTRDTETTIDGWRIFQLLATVVACVMPSSGRKYNLTLVLAVYTFRISFTGLIWLCAYSPGGPWPHGEVRATSTPLHMRPSSTGVGHKSIWLGFSHWFHRGNWAVGLRHQTLSTPRGLHGTAFGGGQGCRQEYSQSWFYWTYFKPRENVLSSNLV